MPHCKPLLDDWLARKAKWDAYEEKLEAYLEKLGNPCLHCNTKAAKKVEAFEKKHEPKKPLGRPPERLPYRGP